MAYRSQLLVSIPVRRPARDRIGHPPPEPRLKVLAARLKVLAAAPLGSGRVMITGLDKGPQISLAELTVDAANRTDGSWHVGVRGGLRTALLVDADAVVRAARRRSWVGSTSIYDATGNELHTWRYAVQADAYPAKLFVSPGSRAPNVRAAS